MNKQRPALKSLNSNNNLLIKKTTSRPELLKPTLKKAVPKNVEDIDKKKSLLFVTDYAADVYKHLKDLEDKKAIVQNFMKLNNPDMSGHHRATIIDWFFSFGENLHIASDTYFIAVNILDRFITNETLERYEYQLAGLTAFLIACKYEEIHYPMIDNLVELCDDLYTKSDFINMEQRILISINFDLSFSYSIQFLRRYTRASKTSIQIHTMAKYFCELSLAHYQLSHIKPSMMAAASLYLSRQLNSINLENATKFQSNNGSTYIIWNETLEHYSSYNAKQLQPIVHLLSFIILNNETTQQQNCRQKYLTDKFFNVAKLSPAMRTVLESYSKNLSNR